MIVSEEAHTVEVTFIAELSNYVYHICDKPMYIRGLFNQNMLMI